MPGVVFLVVIPTGTYERTLVNTRNFTDRSPPNAAAAPNIVASATDSVGGVAEVPQQRAVRLEVELRAKKRAPPPSAVAQFRQAEHLNAVEPPTYESQQGLGGATVAAPSGALSMEELLQQLLLKLNIQHVAWHTAKGGNHYQVVFPLQAGDPCETTLHCLTELRIGRTRGTSVSILPCSVNYDGLHGVADEDDKDVSPDELSKWNSFVDSIKSKLTVKQVVDGVRSGGALSFDYLLLIVTADSLAALGLVENNAPNITAAMLVSPLMGPVMSITFGAMIADRDLVKSGFISLSLGMLISLVFGLIFGLILGSTEMPWGFSDWPTEEMKARGNSRSLWMGVLWALTSGTGVAVALLQGAVGPLIGVAISASLLPPVVNCGLFWSLSCTWLLKSSANGTLPGTKIPHLKGESFVGNATGYVPLYTDYMPVEFFVNGIVSAMLTVINVICIFITAIVVLKIKEVAAPYTASPDLRRFWETDIRTVRRTNRSTMRRRTVTDDAGRVGRVFDKPMQENRDSHLGEALQNALKQLSDDVTFRKVRRMSYSGNAIEEVRIIICIALRPTNSLRLPTGVAAGSAASAAAGSPMASLRNSAGLANDLNALEQILASMTQRQMRSVGVGGRSTNNGSGTDVEQQMMLRRTNSGVRMPTIMEKIVRRGSTSSSRRTSHRRMEGETNEEMVNLTQNVLD